MGTEVTEIQAGGTPPPDGSSGASASRVLGGRYALLERIGSGGMADVYRATDQRLGREVAVKVLRHLDGDPAFVERFRREARHAAGIQHPNVAAVYDVGEDGDDRYIVMELVRGDNLKDIIRRRGPLPEDEALTIAERVARGLQAAHTRGVVHRDLKPHNILLPADGQPRIVDFGIAKAMGGTAITRTAAILGSAHYLSPEQARGIDADERADLYSLGVVLFELLTGAVPFDGDNTVDIALQHVSATVPDPSSLKLGIRADTDAVVHRALEKDPLRRFPTATAMAQALIRARDGRGPVPARRTVSPPRSRRALLLPALVGLVLLLGGWALAGSGLNRAPAGPGTVAAFTASPVPRGSSTPSALPTVAPTVLATAVPATAAPRTPAPVIPSSASSAAVAEFYARVLRRDYAGAAALWSSRMQANYPPAQNIDGRFANTTGLRLLQNEVITQNDVTGRASVAIDLVETTTSGTQRWAGSWDLVRAADGSWLLDRPALAPR